MIRLELKRDYCEDCSNYIPTVKSSTLTIDEDGRRILETVVGCSVDYALPRCFKDKYGICSRSKQGL